MSSYERIADLPLEVEALSFEGRELQFAPEFTRATTLIQLRGPGGETGSARTWSTTRSTT